jgi:hypothetical protein
MRGHLAAEPNLGDFTVDLATREVRHRSGASVSYYEYLDADDWLSTSGGLTRNAYFFDGSCEEFLKLAKQAALAAGMTHRRPEAP